MKRLTQCLTLEKALEKSGKGSEILQSPDEIKAQIQAEVEAQYEADDAAQRKARRDAAERVTTDRAGETEAELAAKIEAAQADGKRSNKAEAYDRTTMIAFGLLFILPAVIIVFSLLFFLPFIARTVQQEPTDAPALRSNSSGLTPENR